MTSAESDPFAAVPVIDLDRTRRVAVTRERGRPCEELTLFYERGAVFAKGVMCEPRRGNRARTFWRQEGTVTLWHENGRKLGEMSPGRTRYWTSEGVLVGELRAGRWTAGRALGGKRACRRGETVRIRGPDLHGEFPKFRDRLAPAFSLVCLQSNAYERLVRMLWSNGQRLFDEGRFFYPSGALAMEVEGALFQAGMGGLDMKPTRCLAPLDGREIPCPKPDAHDWVSAGMFWLREKGQLSDRPLLGTPEKP